MTTQQARTKFYHKYAIGELSMKEADFLVQVISTANTIHRLAVAAKKRHARKVLDIECRNEFEQPMYIQETN